MFPHWGMIYIYIFYIYKLSASKKLRFALDGWKKTHSPDCGLLVINTMVESNKAP